MNEPQRALRCRVVCNVDQQHLPILVSGLSYPGLLNLDAARTQSFKLLLSTTIRRLDLEGSSLFWGGMSFIEQGDELLWLHHPAQLFFRVRKQDLPSPGFARPFVHSAMPRIELLEIPATDTAPSTKAIRVFIRETDQEWQHEITCQRGGDPQLSLRLLQMLVGDQACHQASGYPWNDVVRHVVQLGMPSTARLAVRKLNEQGFHTVSQTLIEDIIVGQLDEAELAVPKSYKNAHELRESTSGAPTRQGLTRISPVERHVATSDLTVARRRQPLIPRQRMIPRNGDGGHDPGDGAPDPDGGGSPPPEPRTTTASSMAVRIEQDFFDVLESSFNKIAAYFSDFRGENGRIVIEWLKLLRDDVEHRGSNARGTFFFRMLHDVDFPDQGPGGSDPPPTNPDCERSRGRGLLDRAALREARSLFRSGTYPSELLQTMSPPDRALMASCGTNWDALPDGIKLRLACELVEPRYGTAILEFPSTLKTEVLGLMNVRLDNMFARMLLPTVPPPPEGALRKASLMTLRARDDGAIVGSLNLGTIVLTGTLTRTPTPLYVFAVGASAFISLFVPALWWVFPFLVSVGLFLALDVAELSVVADSLSAGFTLRFLPGTSAALEPKVDVNVTGSMSLLGLSYVPTGLHQIVDSIVGLILGNAGVLMSMLERVLSDKLSSPTQSFLGTGFPGSMLRLGLPISGGQAAGLSTTSATKGHIYLETTFGQPAGAPITITPVPVRENLRLEQELDLRRVLPQFADDRPPRHYVSLSLSQNTLNQILAVMWHDGHFDEMLSRQDVLALMVLAQPPLSARSYDSVMIAPSIAPQLTLTAGLPGGQSPYAALQVNGTMNLELNPNHRFNVSFNLQAPAQVVIGSAFSSTRFISLGTAVDQPLDVLLDLTLLSPQVTRIREITTTEVRTEHWERDKDGKPYRVIDYSDVDVVTEHPLTPQSSASHVPLVVEALRRGYALRSSSLRAPRKDGVGSTGPTHNAEPLDQQLYTFDGMKDPDDLSSTDLAAPVWLGVGGGLWHAHAGLRGLVESLLDESLVAGFTTARYADVFFLKGLKDPLTELSEEP